jgi:hypothetical protein
VDPVPDPLFLRKSGSAGNRPRELWICSQELWPLDHRGGRNLSYAKSKHLVRFQVFMTVTMKNAVFWDVTPCRSCVNRRFRGTQRLHLQGRKIRQRGASVSRWQSAVTCSSCFLAHGFFYPEDGGDTFFRNVGSHKMYTASHPRRRHSSVNIFFSSVYDNMMDPEKRIMLPS